MSDQDPAVRTWGESLAASADQAASTSALLRKLTGELAQLRRDYSAVLLERNQAWSQLANAEQIIRDAHERAEEARTELDEAVRRAADFEQVREELRQKTLQHEGCIDDYQQWESEKADFVERSLALKAKLAEALDANTALSFDHAKALIAVDQLTREVERLDARTARHARAYQLTDKGRAATETTEGAPDAEVP